MASELAGKLLEVLDQLSGGVHPGFRPVHAKGVMFSGTFTPSAGAAKLTRAPHAVTAVDPGDRPVLGLGRHSDSRRQRREGSSPQGMAMRFHLADTSTPTSSPIFNGFPARTGEELLEFFQRSPQADRVLPLRRRSLRSWPPTRRRRRSSRPRSRSRRASPGSPISPSTPSSSQRRRTEPVRPVPPRPRSRDRVLDPRASEQKTADFLAAEMSERLSKGPVEFRVLVQMAEDGDDVTNATVIWPETRQLVEFGTVTLTERVDELAPERRKIIFDPVPQVDGIDPSGDPLTEVRSDVYLLSGRRRRADAAK